MAVLPAASWCCITGVGERELQERFVNADGVELSLTEHLFRGGALRPPRRLRLSDCASSMFLIQALGSIPNLVLRTLVGDSSFRSVLQMLLVGPGSLCLIVRPLLQSSRVSM